jgi:hypothetical protein
VRGIDHALLSGVRVARRRRLPTRRAFRAPVPSSLKTAIRQSREALSSPAAGFLFEHLERSGFVIMKKPPIGGSAALGRGHESK